MTETTRPEVGIRGGDHRGVPQRPVHRVLRRLRTQHFAEPRGVTVILGSAADYAGIPQNALLAVITGVVFRFLSRQQRSDQVLRIAGAMAFAAAAVAGALTVTGLLPGVSAAAVGAVLASTVWLLAIGIRGARLPGPRHARVARTARLIAATMLCSGVVALTGFAIGVAAVVWTGLIAGCLAWLSIPFWVLATGRALVPSQAVLPVSWRRVRGASARVRAGLLCKASGCSPI